MVPCRHDNNGLLSLKLVYNASYLLKRSLYLNMSDRLLFHTYSAAIILFNNVSMSTYVYTKSIDYILISIKNLKTSKIDLKIKFSRLSSQANLSLMR